METSSLPALLKPDSDEYVWHDGPEFIIDIKEEPLEDLYEKDSDITSTTRIIRGECLLIENVEKDIYTEQFSEGSSFVIAKKIKIKSENKEDSEDVEKENTETLSDGPSCVKSEEINIKSEDEEDSTPSDYVVRKKDDNSTSYKCHHCDYQTVEESNLKRKLNRKDYLKAHLLRQKTLSEAKTFNCDQCDFHTNHKGHWSLHKLQHKDGDMFKCDTCGYRMIHRSYYKRHALEHKSDDKIDLFKCDLYNFNTIYKSALRKHSRQHPENNDTCDYCDYRTTSVRYLKTHMLTHKYPEEVNVFKCDNCQYRTIFSSTFKKHLLKHINQFRPFKVLIHTDSVPW